MTGAISISSQESIFGGISILKENLTALINEFKKAIDEHTKTIKYNNLCVEIIRDMENLSAFYFKLKNPIEDKQFKDISKKLIKIYQEINDISCKRMCETGNKSKKYDEKIFFASLALVEIISFSLDDDLMKSMGGYKKANLIELGKTIYE
ncbi:hypothetical protein YZ31_05775 [Campylobacter lari]|uniref:hypothetical protein n=1 Tax=Campylobacter lari TaxID=201 RepID=UPI0012748616|nr:hypothetical protein [Campylobacter lari]EAK9869592.1 hypothetical protein [Campylobacter lari]EAL2460146.1 hypothetical protein [Campylobacter lari]EAL3935719.1 hypothetical protein [Campylobacter lari]